MSVSNTLLSSPDQKSSGEPKKPAVEYFFSPDIPGFFQNHGFSLIVSTYQAQRIMTLCSNGQKMSMLMRVFPRPTGLAVEPRRMAMCAKNQLWIFDVPSSLRDPQGAALPYDVCYVPRSSHVTGDVAAHEVIWWKNAPLFVNTRFSCFSTLTPDASFMPGWQPRFITACLPDDRCHLNGIAVDERGPKYATALGETDTPQGWRENKAHGGIVIDVPSGEVVARGISMPHSPRYYQGKLWVLESGIGELQIVDPKTGKRETVVRLPGFLRGLAFYQRFAFVGLCKIREKKEFGGLPIETMYPALQCSIHIVDIYSGTSIGFIEFSRGIEEIFDVHVLPGVRNPHVIGFEEDTLDGIYIMPG